MKAGDEVFEQANHMGSAVDREEEWRFVMSSVDGLRDISRRIRSTRYLSRKSVRFVRSVSCSFDYFRSLYAFIIVKSPGVIMIECLVAKETRCPMTFPNDVNQANVIQIFEHLYRHHRAKYDYITNDWKEWMNEKEVSWFNEC